MAAEPSPAQRAVQITFVLKGHLKNVQVAYIRAAALLAKVRDEGLHRALKHDSMESYAAERLGLQRASLYRYLQIYDWLRRSHREWLAKHPKGFIPELSDAYALMWIEERLADGGLGPVTRAELEALRKKALAGRHSQPPPARASRPWTAASGNALHDRVSPEEPRRHVPDGTHGSPRSRGKGIAHAEQVWQAVRLLRAA